MSLEDIQAKPTPLARQTKPAIHARKSSTHNEHHPSAILHLFPVLLDQLPTRSDPLQNVFSVLVQLQLGDDDFRRSDADGDGLTVRLLFGDTLDVDDIFETVNGSDLALTALVRAANNLNLIVLANGDGADLQTAMVSPHPSRKLWRT